MNPQRTIFFLCHKRHCVRVSSLFCEGNCHMLTFADFETSPFLAELHFCCKTWIQKSRNKGISSGLVPYAILIFSDVLPLCVYFLFGIQQHQGKYTFSFLAGVTGNMVAHQSGGPLHCVSMRPNDIVGSRHQAGGISDKYLSARKEHICRSCCLFSLLGV